MAEGTLASLHNAPLSGFALVVSGNTRDFVHVLSEINKGKGDEAENS